MKLTLLVAAGLLALPVAALAASAHAGEGAGEPASAEDQVFVRQAAIDDRSAVQEAKLAELKARAPDVQQFARRMIADHGANLQRLRHVAARVGIALPPGEDARHAQQYDALQKRNGRDFDRSYVGDQIAAHREMERLLRTEVRSGSNAAVRHYAERTLPMIEQHLRLAKALTGTHGG